MQQVELFTPICILQGDEEPVTVSRFSRIAGQGDAQIIKQLQKLFDVELVERTQILNKQGRGRAFHLSIKHTPKTARLIAALDRVTPKKRPPDPQPPPGALRAPPSRASEGGTRV